MIDQILGINWSAVLMTIGYVVAAYVILCVIIGAIRGWGAVKTIFHWTAKLWWLFIVIIALILYASSSRGKRKRQEELSDHINELRAIEARTAENNRKLAELENERKRVEQEIVDNARIFREKVERLKGKPSSDPQDPSKDPPPGEAGKSSNGLTNSW